MKKIIITISILFAVSHCLNSFAQSWNIGGNNVPVNATFGTTNNRPVLFITNKTEKMRLTPLGNLNFTSSSQSIQFANPSGTINPMMFMFSTGSANPDRMVIAHSPILPDWGLQYSDVSDQFNFLGSSFPVLSVGLNSHLVGIGTTSPAAKLQITGGTDESPAEGGYLVTGDITGANVAIDENEIMARDNGGPSALFLNHNGGNLIIDGTNAGTFVGINTSLPAVETHIVHGFGSNIHGLRINHVSPGFNRQWNLYTTSGGFLELSTDGVTVGSFNPTTGAYTSFSDARVKKDIEDASDVLDKVMQLRVKKYHFLKNASGDRKYYGLIAQEAEKIFPEVVTHNKLDGGGDYYTMDYTAYGVLAIKALQEQQKKINDLEDRIAKLETILASVAPGKVSSATGTVKDAALEQNQPNPFDQSTTIRYHLPQGAKGQINIYDTGGVLVKSITANESGQVQINGVDLKSGTYTYTLMVNGQLAASKKLVLTK
ncbi:MAG TPA: tail fiber domain-containing protein [Chitinophagaceae bacterium]|jgi:hypothetical protein